MVSLTWRRPQYDGGAVITGYKIEERDGKAATWVTAGEVGGFDLMYDVRGLIEGYEYFFQVSAKNIRGYGPPAELKQAIVPSKQKGE